MNSLNNRELSFGPKGAATRGGQGGAVAQLGERIVRNDEVRGSIPLSSTSPGKPIPFPSASALSPPPLSRAMPG